MYERQNKIMRFECDKKTLVQIVADRIMKLEGQRFLNVIGGHLIGPDTVVNQIADDTYDVSLRLDSTEFRETINSINKNKES